MPAMKMIVQNFSNRIPLYNSTANKSIVNSGFNNKMRQVPRMAIGGAMIGRIQFSKSGCSSCGH